ncbi:biotin/lipoyl-containing protein, partial [Sphaerisporangium aureirubrum]|uniref:biotin/lipoyl-containing protein n=1 Tax=Sphaerisporangium aureirubrum TaxID=1544736 RepID=UPI00363DAE2D
MRREFKLPDVGEGLTEAEIIKWHVAAGDQVELNQTIVEIETAKAVVELPCPFEGVVGALMVAEGETVDVGTPIIAVDTGEGADTTRETALADDMVPTLPAEPEQATRGEGTGGTGQPARTPVLVGYGVKAGATTRRPRRTGPAPAPRRAARARR